MRKLFFIGLAFSLLLIATTARSVMAQNATTNASNAMGNMSASANKTGTEMAANMSNTMGNASKSASSAMNKTGESVNATANELGKNATEMGSTLLNKTGEVAKKIVGGAATVLGNISGEIKKGIGEK
jgi:hypothetical protein